MKPRNGWIVLCLLLLFAAFAVAQQRVDVGLVGGAAPVTAVCDSAAKVTSVNINLGAGTGNTELVAISGSTVIYVCGFRLWAGGADTTQFITGTGTACASGETDKETFNFSADNGYAIAIPNGGSVQFKTASGGALCVERTSSVALAGIVTYVQE